MLLIERSYHVFSGVQLPTTIMHTPPTKVFFGGMFKDGASAISKTDIIEAAYEWREIKKHLFVDTAKVYVDVNDYLEPTWPLTFYITRFEKKEREVFVLSSLMIDATIDFTVIPKV